MIYRTVNLNPNHDKWDSYSRSMLLDAWKIHYYENNINMSPIEGMYQGGQGYFDSQIYFSSLDIHNLRNISPTDANHPVNIAFQKRQKELEIEFDNSVQADRERLSHLIELEKDSHDFWQKSELYLKVLGEDPDGNLYPKELVDEVRFEKNLSEENFRCSMEDLINYDIAYNHPLSYPNRDFSKFPVTDKERQEWCNRESLEGIKREYTDINGIDQENKILNEKSLLDEKSFRGVFPSYINDDRIPKNIKEFYNKYNPSSTHNEQLINKNHLSSNQKQNRIEGKEINELEEKINNYRFNQKILEDNSLNIDQTISIEKKEERIKSAEEKVKDILPKHKDFKVMPEMNKEKGFFASWVEKTKEKVIDFKEKAITLWEDRVAPKLGFETERSRKEAHQEIINKINLQEIREFEKNIAKKQRPRGESEAEKEDQEMKETLSKKRRPTSGVNDVIKPENNDIREIKNKPTGDSSEQKYKDVKIDEDRFSHKIK